MSNRNRDAGHSFERACVKRLKEIGFEFAASSRAVNRSRDAQKIDIANEDELVNGRFPYNIQCKNTTKLNYEQILKELPITPGVPNVVLHKRTEKSGTNFMTKGTFCFMHAEDFLEMVSTIENLKTQLKICNEKQL